MKIKHIILGIILGLSPIIGFQIGYETADFFKKKKSKTEEVSLETRLKTLEWRIGQVENFKAFPPLDRLDILEYRFNYLQDHGQFFGVKSGPGGWVTNYVMMKQVYQIK